MNILEVATGAYWPAEITAVVQADLKNISVKRHVFRWRPLFGVNELYKLTLVGSPVILGLMELEEHTDEQRLEIKLLTASVENIGGAKIYDRIAGCLIAFAARQAIDRFDENPAISLLPKTVLRPHYMAKYGMQNGGLQLFLEDEGLVDVIYEYLI